MTEQASKGRILLVEAQCGATDVLDAHARLQTGVSGSTPDQPVVLDISGAGPTAFCLQLLVAARKSLDRNGAFGGFGPAAQAALSLD